MTEKNTMVVVMNHSMTEEQMQDARDSLGVVEFVTPPAMISKLWADIPPDLETFYGYLDPLCEWLTAESKRHSHYVYLLIQGDVGATHHILIAKRGLGEYLPLYSTTKRDVVEEKVGGGGIMKRSVFRHVRFRSYA